MPLSLENLSWQWCYTILFIKSVVLAWLLTPLAARLGRRWKLLDMPGGRKAHLSPTPRSGGIALFVSYWAVVGISVAAAVVVSVEWGKGKAPFASLVASIPRRNLIQLLAIFIGASWILAVGLLDDRRSLRPWAKLFCQIAATVPMLLTGIHIVSFLPWKWLGALTTVAWMVLLINSFNFLDNMDGLSAGVAAIVAAVLAWISFGSNELLMTAMFVALAGGLLGFLRHNFSPATIFMGDSGSMFVGYMIGVLTVLATYYQQGVPTKLPVLTPLIVLGVPLFDTFSVLWIRWRAGRPLMEGDRNHFSHRLVNLGMSERGAVVFIYATTFCVALGALPLRHLDWPGALLVAVQTVLWFVIIYWIERLGKQAAER